MTESKVDNLIADIRALQSLARLEGKLEAFAAALKQCSGQNTERTSSQIQTAIDILHLDTLRSLKSAPDSPTAENKKNEICIKETPEEIMALIKSDKVQMP